MKLTGATSNMKKNVTFSDIAKYANVSKATVSRYFNNPECLTQTTKQKIATVLEQLNYQENKVARILANGKTEFIGIIMPNLFHQYYTQLLNHILETYSKYGYKFIVFSGKEDLQQERQYISELLAYQIEGLIVLSHTIPSYELKQLPIPVVSIEREDTYISSVNTNNYHGGVQATKKLIQNQCDILIHINNSIDKKRPAYGRIQGFIDICEQYHKPYQVIFEELDNCYLDYLHKMEQVLKILQKQYPKQKKGVFCSNDTIANALLNVLVRQQIQIPNQYEVIGFDNSVLSQQSIIPMTTIAQNIEQIAAYTMEILTKQIEQKKHALPQQPIRQMVVEPEIIVRETTL